MSTARIIIDQIKTIDNWAFGSWGAKNFVNTGNGLRFKTSGVTPWKGHVHIVYNAGTDLYDLEFLRVRKLAVISDKKVFGVFVDELVATIDDFVG